ncbi:hypothetical protein SLEP1_g58026 [Rubroshorea leprosula]|uniref:Uncharacterized protein n=1 Tax=Rubroshorea leprosula TaxID=152421 RepID=A0AAV5MQD9_9ROSI|nr:hypothetical protein SLEP1_g58026 [Rubroshorea leprosula]
METLVVVEQHRNQYHSRVRSNGSGRFGSSPSRNFRQINCRTFQSSAGVLPSPFKQSSSPVGKRGSSFSSPAHVSSPHTPSPGANSHYVNGVDSRSSVKSSPIPISNHRNPKKKSFNGLAGGGLSYSELWAGPAYSNSPPPNSLPMPKFSLREKRAVSLDLPAPDPVFTVHPTAKSAPTSPTRVHKPSATELLVTVDSATRTLRRILNLESADD